MFRLKKLILFKEDYKKVYALVALLFLSSVVEVLSLSSVMPFMAAISDIDRLLSYGAAAFIYEALGNDEQALVVFSACVVVGLMLINAILFMLSTKLMLQFANDTGANLSSALYRVYLHKEYAFHINHSSSFITNNIVQEVSRYTQNVLIPFLRVTARIFLLVLLVCFLAFVDFVVTMLVFSFFLLLYLCTYFLLKRKLKNNGFVVSSENKKRISYINDSFRGIKETKIMSFEDIYIEQYKNSVDQISRATASSQYLSQIPRAFIELIAFSAVVIIVMLLYRGGSIIDKMPVVMVFMLAGYKILPAMQQIYNNIVLIRANYNSLHEMGVLSDFQIIKKCYTAPFEKIVIDSVGFSYPENNKKVLDNVSLEIISNSKIVISGKSGSGKTTLLDLICGLLEPSKGKISYHYSNKVESDFLVGLFSYVAQDVHLVEGSVADNILACSNQNIEEKDILHTLELLDLKDFVLGLPDGLDSHLGENGSLLSGGQKQRIGIARAILSESPVVILDECTSALDKKTELKVIRNLLSIQDKTMIFITHSKDVIDLLDLSYVIAAGKLSFVR